MSGNPRIRRQPAGRARHSRRPQPPGPPDPWAGADHGAGMSPVAGPLDIAAAASVAAGQNRAAPAATTPRQRTITMPRLSPHTVQLCIHCRQNPAGSWVSRTRGLPARRPWCLSCCQHLDPGRYHLVPFEGHGRRRFR